VDIYHISPDHVFPDMCQRDNEHKCRKQTETQLRNLQTKGNYVIFVTTTTTTTTITTEVAVSILAVAWVKMQLLKLLTLCKDHSIHFTITPVLIVLTIDITVPRQNNKHTASGYQQLRRAGSKVKKKKEMLLHK